MAFINEDERFCTKCGTSFEKRKLEGEGLVQFCPKCNVYQLPVFNTSCSMEKQNKGA